jgi:hypothetical protein
MRFAPLVAASALALLVAAPAAAYNGPEDYVAKPTKIGFEVAIDGGGFFGAHGGDVKDSCGDTAKCHDEKLHAGTRFGGRAGVSLPDKRIGFDVDLGFWSGSSRTGRAMNMYGEQNLSVPVDFTDSVSWSGTSFGVAFRYDAMLRPIVVTAAATVGYISLAVDVERTGTITTDTGVVPVYKRTEPVPTVNTSAYFLAPEVRVAVPIGDHIRIGVAASLMLSSNFEVRPTKMYQSGDCGLDSCKYQGHAIGFVPQANVTPENQMEHLYLLRGSLFASANF